MDKIDSVRRKYLLLDEHLNELTRRLWAATEALALGHGGIVVVAKATGLSTRTINRGIAQLNAHDTPSCNKIRLPGAGRKLLEQEQPGILEKLEALVEPLTRGDPESPLRWTCKSTRRLAEEMRKDGWRISNYSVDVLLRGMEYSLQGNRKTTEGNQHPDRNAQFEHINARVAEALAGKVPVISVDTKKKELIGSYANRGRKWLKQGQPHEVNGHDFPDVSVPRAYPYGVYDLAANQGFVNVGTHHDTAAFAVKSIESWWRAEGRLQYPRAPRLVITADGGGSNGSRLRLWKWELQRLSNRLGFPISVLHFPPGTSKWNKVEHRLFSFISSNWRGEPLVSYETMVNLILRTSTDTGLKVKCRLDMRKYPLGKKVSDEEMDTINIGRSEFHGEWNYTISPNKKIAQ